jgi:hypothetical protein
MNSSKLGTGHLVEDSVADKDSVGSKGSMISLDKDLDRGEQDSKTRSETSLRNSRNSSVKADPADRPEVHVVDSNRLKAKI